MSATVECQECGGDGYLDIPDPETGGVMGPRCCPECNGGSRRSEAGPSEPEHPDVTAAFATLDYGVVTDGEWGIPPRALGEGIER